MNGLKNINRAKFLFFFYLVLQALPLFAGMDTSSRARTEIAPRSFNKTELSEYAKQREFQYGEEKKAGLSAWDSFWRWFWNTLGHAISKTASSRLGGGVILLVIVGLLVYIVVSSRGLAIRQVFSGDQLGLIPERRVRKIYIILISKLRYVPQNSLETTGLRFVYCIYAA